ELPPPHVLAGRGHRRGRPRRAGDARGQPRATRVGTGSSPRGLELLLVPEGSGRELLRVLLRHGLRRVRRAVDTRGARRGQGTLQLGAATPTVVPLTRRPRRAHDRRPLDPMTIDDRPIPGGIQMQNYDTDVL